MILTLLIIFIWIIAGILIAGYELAYFRRKYPDTDGYESDRRFAVSRIKYGLIGLTCLYTVDIIRGDSFAYGWMNPLGKNPYA